MGKTTFGSNMGLLHLGILLVLLNLSVIFFFDIEISRAVRLFSSVAILLFVLFKNGFKKSLLFLGLLLLVAKDVSILFYESPLFKTISLLCTVSLYTVITLFVFRRLPVLRFSLTLVLFGLGIIVLNIFNVFYLSDIIIPSLDNDTQLILFFTQSAVMLFMALFGFLYNEAYEGKQSLNLLLCILAFIFSDLGGLAAYFLGYDPAYYAERAFYIIAVSYLAYYVVNFNQAADRVSELQDNQLSA
ncbi:hypothetical protein [Marinirhabdus gelatinilytica]|uniref:YhhN-like protein n=1 Tax=Marinirhabdus gelatinilytica TaxID=1703343 RepID=A0A370Q4F5_9FLAO|nr:hypothetical protein [Marinirhabdus gelatinilytica]RDK83251.1 hypothetical protein C8D94_10839 [Marinirhabdus gelatinilytica]